MYNSWRREATTARSSSGVCEGTVHPGTPGIILTVGVDVYTLVTKLTVWECSAMEIIIMCLVVKKTVFRFPTSSHTYRAVQPHKMARLGISYLGSRGMVLSM